MTRKERKNQGIYKTTKGKYYQCYYDDEGCTTMSPLFDSPEEVAAWFRKTGINPDNRPHGSIFG